jgi:diaminopimelate epimerase
MRTTFVKMHSAKNDFAVFDERRGSLGLSASLATALADRHRGIGCDQIISLEPSEKADAFMRIRNADGSEASAGGSATACVAMLLAHEGDRRSLAIETVAGILHAEILDAGRVRVDMGAPRLLWNEIPLARPLDTLRLPLAEAIADPVGVEDPAAASMGNPHITFFAPDVDRLNLQDLGPLFERDPLFPERVNVGFAAVLAPDRMRLRVWERGVGLTLASGSGACAAVVNANRRGLCGTSMEVVMDGGAFDVEWRADGHVLMSGPIATAFTGEVDLAAYAR